MYFSSILPSLPVSHFNEQVTPSVSHHTSVNDVGSNGQAGRPYTVVPSQLKYSQASGGEKTLLPETLYISGSGFDGRDGIATLSFGDRRNLEIPAKYISPNLVACTLEYPVTLPESIGGATLKVEGCCSGSIEIALPCEARSEGALRPIEGDDHAMFLINPKGNVINGVLTFAKPFPRSEAEAMLQRILDDSKLESFSATPIVSAGGQAHWALQTEDSKVDVNDHLHQVALDPDRDGKEQLTQLLSKLTSTPLSPSRPMWGMWLVDDYRDRDGDNELKSVMIFRSHHIISDGIGLVLSLFRSAGIDIDKVDFPGKRLRSKKETLDHVEPVRSISALPYRLINALFQPLRNTATFLDYASVGLGALYRMLVLPPEPKWSPFNVDAPIEEANVGWSSKPLQVDQIKSVAKKHEITLNDVVLSLVSGALHKAAQQDKDFSEALASMNVPKEQIHTLLSVSIRDMKDLSSKGNIISNRVGSVTVPMYIQKQSAVERAKSINNFTQKFFYGAGPAIMKGFAWLGAKVPQVLEEGGTLTGREGVMLSKLGYSVTAILSNVPGPTGPIGFGKEGEHLLSDMRFLLSPNILSRVPIIVTAFSYQGLMSLSITVAKALQLDPDQLLTYVDETFDELVQAKVEVA